MSENRFPMKMVTQRTGLSAHVLRVWERRYEAVTPERTKTNRRFYSEEEMRRLELLARLTRAGHSIGQIAQHGLEDLEALAEDIVEQAEVGMPGTAGNAHAEQRASAVELHQTRAWQAVVDLDGTGLEKILDQVTREIGGSAMIEKVIVPLVCKIGESWDSGEISVAQERVASTVIQEVLLIAGRPHSETRGAPDLVVATPAGQLHELGAALVVCLARRRGWSVTYLGASIPAEEIAHVASIKGSPAVALSIVYPADDPGMAAELKQLRKLLPDACGILVGGRAAGAYHDALEAVGARQIFDLGQLKAWLDEERKRCK